VRAADLVAWEQRAEVSPRRAANRDAHLDDTPAEPFAGENANQVSGARRRRGGR
jgi:hypothetical protein